jgi:hypothetical protein
MPESSPAPVATTTSLAHHHTFFSSMQHHITAALNYNHITTLSSLR